MLLLEIMHHQVSIKKHSVCTGETSTHWVTWLAVLPKWRLHVVHRDPSEAAGEPGQDRVGGSASSPGSLSHSQIWSDRISCLFLVTAHTCGILAPQGGMEPETLQRKHGVLTTGPPGSPGSPVFTFACWVSVEQCGGWKETQNHLSVRLDSIPHAAARHQWSPLGPPSFSSSNLGYFWFPWIGPGFGASNFSLAVLLALALIQCA